MLTMVGDFETTTNPDDVRVWAYCLVDIDKFDIMSIGNNIDRFIDYISKINSTVYFHNLKFDGEFILSYLLTHGYKCNESKEPGTFTTLISDTGQFYNITIYFAKYNKRYHKCQIFDSLKKIPLSVEKIATSFKLPMKKLHIDYKADRPVGHELTKEEYEYVQTDCMIVAQALHIQIEQGLTHITIGSDALNSFKFMMGRNKFMYLFPTLSLEMDADLRRAYKGGFVYLNPKYKNKRVYGHVFDINSLYPYVMHERPLPYGYPIPYDGQYEPDAQYPLYIQKISCEFKLKPGYLPTIQLKNNRSFIQTEYLKSSNGEIVEMTLTNVDLKLFLEHYKVYNLEYINGYKFKQCTKVFNKYIDFWADVKAKNKGGLRQLAKLMLNSLYGKFATNPLCIEKIPYLDDKEIVKYKLSNPDYKDTVYLPVGIFVTSWAREKTITTAQANIDRFIYADTDSVHLLGFEPGNNIEIHPTKLGAFKEENIFINGKYLRAKTYMETSIKRIRSIHETGTKYYNTNEISVKCAGMPDNVKKLVTYDNFTVGTSYEGKLVPKRYKGGVILTDTDFSIKE